MPSLQDDHDWFRETDHELQELRKSVTPLYAHIRRHQGMLEKLEERVATQEDSLEVYCKVQNELVERVARLEEWAADVFETLGDPPTQINERVARLETEVFAEKRSEPLPWGDLD